MESQMQIKLGEMSQGLKPLLALLGIQTSFDETTMLTKRLLLVYISDNSIRKALQGVGENRWHERRNGLAPLHI